MVVKAIKALAQAEVRLNSQYVITSRDAKIKDVLKSSVGKELEGKSFYQAAVREFGSWKAAIQAAEMDYAEIKNNNPTFWTHETVVTAIRALEAAGYGIYKGGIRGGQTDKNVRKIIFDSIGRLSRGDFLYKAAVRIFGSWSDAVEAAGFDLQKLEEQTTAYYWTDEMAQTGIRALKSAGLNVVNIPQIRSSSNTKVREVLLDSIKKDIEGETFYQNVVRQFGAWDKALEAAGIDVSFEIFREGIKGLIEAGIPLGSMHVRSQEKAKIRAVLRQALGIGRVTSGSLFGRGAILKFGSWTKAIEAVGFDAEKLQNKNRRTSDLPILPHQSEWVRLDDGSSRKVTYLGTPTKLPDQIVEEQETASIVEEAVESLPEEDAIFAEQIFDAILELEEPWALGQIVEQINVHADQKVSSQKIEEIFRKLASHPRLQALREFINDY